jgi:hypothetical protein
MEFLERQLNREAVRYAVQRAIFCPDCGGILDMDDAVLITGSGGAGVACGACWDRTWSARSSVEQAEQSGSGANTRRNDESDKHEVLRPDQSSRFPYQSV